MFSWHDLYQKANDTVAIFFIWYQKSLLVVNDYAVLILTFWGYRNFCIIYQPHQFLKRLLLCIEKLRREISGAKV